MKASVILQCISCALVPALTMAVDQHACTKGGCEANPEMVDLLQNQQVLATRRPNISGKDRALLTSRRPKRIITQDDRALLCDASAQSFPRGASQKIRWLHIPKTGSSFMRTVWHWGCDVPDDLRPFGQREPQRQYPLEKSCPKLIDHSPRTHKPIGPVEWKEGTFVTMLREPQARMCSGYMNGRHCIEDCNPECNGCHGIRDFSTERAIAIGTKYNGSYCQEVHEARSFQEYAALRQTQGCATKMIAGLPCSEPVAQLRPLFDVAYARLKQFAFVGLVEEWDLSVCLFHRILGQAPLPDENDKMGSKTYMPEYASTCAEGKLASATKDSADAKLYELGQNIFWAQVHSVLATLRGVS